MGDIYEEIYAPRLHPSDRPRSCLALHPDGSVTLVTRSGGGGGHPVIPERGHLGATDGYGYNLSCFFAAADSDNPPATAFHRACIFGHKYAENQTIQGPLYLWDSFRDLKLCDWKFIKYCWRSQTEDVKAKWKRLNLSIIIESNLDWDINDVNIRQTIAAVQSAKTLRAVVYIAATRRKCLEFSLSKREIMLIAHPLMDSMEGTGVMDNVEYCSGNHDLCLSKYTDELIACAKLCSFQEKNGIDPGTFKPDLAIPIETEDMNSCVWVQSDSVGDLNWIATKLLRMKVLGDAIVARKNGHGLEDIKPVDVDSMVGRARESKRTCSFCGAQGIMKLCGKCGFASYCGQNCQHSDWTTHKEVCVDVEVLWTH